MTVGRQPWRPSFAAEGRSGGGRGLTDGTPGQKDDGASAEGSAGVDVGTSGDAPGGRPHDRSAGTMGAASGAPAGEGSGNGRDGRQDGKQDAGHGNAAPGGDPGSLQDKAQGTVRHGEPGNARGEASGGGSSGNSGTGSGRGTHGGGEEPAPLLPIIAARIRAQGPMSLADYMTLCLLHPQHGYYTTRAPFGARGDFITAPEISQMFGELLGLAIAQAWMDQGAPAPFVLAELGPGRGSLMRDALRATRRVPGFHAAARLHLVEASPALRAVQRDALSGHDVTWSDTPGDLPEAPLFLIANEFFDALPIRQFHRRGVRWHERMVALDAAGRLQFGLGPDLPDKALPARLVRQTPRPEIVETCPAASPIATQIGRRIARNGGAAIIIDYGEEISTGDTFQAMRAHSHVDPLAEPGRADLTAHVDFGALAQAATAAGAVRTKLVPQGVFLERLGITHRAQALARQMTGAALESHVAAHRRLTHPAEMGSLFKCLGLRADGAPPLSGLEP